LTDALEPLRRRFLARARDDLAAIKAHLAGETLASDELRLLVHRLAGAGGTFGYQDISQSAGEAEDEVLQERDPRPALLRLQDVLTQHVASS